MRRSLKAIKWFGFLMLLLWTWCVNVLHLGVLTPPAISPEAHSEARFFDKSRFGIHQLILQGDPYGRGQKAGVLTKDLLLEQEVELTEFLFRKIPKWVLLVAEIPLIRFFWGAERFVEPWMLAEMYGVSRSAPHQFDDLIDGFTRQLAYHGLHEVGQMMVDQSGDVMGCTVVAAPFGRDWVLGRNFDFEGGRILDREKILKWTFPDSGLAYVSVIWAGMVGAVTAVNEQGIYLSINAAGSQDRRRFGMPSTLLVAKVMQSARTATEALGLLRAEAVFITDIYVLLDAKSGELYRIEKSPAKTQVLRLEGPSVVANHLVDPIFVDDPVNRFRREELTSIPRMRRAEFLLRQPQFVKASSARALEEPVLQILRDKGEFDGQALELGHRMAIDPLIATHSVIFNSAEQVLFVSQGPALSGGFVGFDLRASFRRREPVVIRRLPPDPAVTPERFAEVKFASEKAELAAQALRRHDCAAAKESLHQAVWQNSSTVQKVLGDWNWNCLGNHQAARSLWQHALDLHPAYPQERRELESRLKEFSL